MPHVFRAADAAPDPSEKDDRLRAAQRAAEQSALAAAYTYLQRAVGVIALMLPIVLVGVNFVFFDHDVKGSISEYYYTPVGSVFVGSLCALAVFFLSYNHRPLPNYKVDNYLSSIRDVERRIQLAEAQSSRELPEVDKPSGIPSTFEEHAELMYSLQLLAMQCDLTRVVTFMYGREITGRTYPALGINESHHSISHHGNDPEKLAKLVLIQTHHMNLLSKYLEKLKATPDGDGTLLDHSTLMFTAGLSNSDRHSHTPLFNLVVGGGGGTLKGGRHIVFPEGTPKTNLYMTLLQKMGVQVEKIGDSTGTFRELSELSQSTSA